MVTDSQSRSTRFNLHVPVSFNDGDRVVHGLCENVSASGLLATFEKYLDIWTIGELSLMVDEYYLNIKARVVREQGRDYGMAFLIDSDNDLLTVRIIFDFASAHVVPGEKLKPGL